MLMHKNICRFYINLTWQCMFCLERKENKFIGLYESKTIQTKYTDSFWHLAIVK